MEPRKITEETLAAFARQLGEEERSPATLEKYLREVRQFAAFLGGREVTRELAAAWREELSARQSPATVNGKHELKSLTIDPEAVDPEDVEMLQDMIVAAVNEAMRAADADAAGTMQKLTGGLGLPF